MPKRKPGMSPEEQSESFRAKVREMIDAGELNPTDADAAFERVVKAATRPPKGDRDL
jgi:hypothetical protein